MFLAPSARKEFDVPENTSKSGDFKSRYPDSVAPNANVGVLFLRSVIQGRVKIIGMPVSKDIGPVMSRTFDTTSPGDCEAMRAYIARFETMEGYNVFYAANRTSPRAGSVPSRDEIDQVRLVLIDLDPAKGKPLVDERDRIRVVADHEIHGPVPPRAVVDTGGGAQIAYVLEQPIEITPANRAAVTGMIEALMKDLSRRFGADTATCRIEALFRVPGTWNWPTDAKIKAGRTLSVSNQWYIGDTAASLDALRSITLVEGTPADPTPQDTPGVDLGEVDENALVEVLAKPDRLPQRLKALVATSQPLALAIKHPVNPGDTSAYDNHLCMRMVSLRIPAGDMALLLAAYGEKVKTAHYEQNRLFSYVRTTVGNAIAKDPANLHGPEGFDEALAAAEREQREQAQADRAAKFRFLSYEEAIAGIFDEDEGAVIQGLLRRKEMAVFYGMTGSGKTFASVDIACRISLGMEWNGRATTKLRVAYIAAEASGSIKRRLAAWGKVHGLNPDVHVLTFGPDLFHAPSATEGQMTDMNRLFSAADAIKPSVFFIDTLARTMIGGNENSTADMNALIANGDRLRDRYAANVIWVHHTGKDEGLGARGSSALKSATDLEVVIKGASDPREFSVTKLRDGDPFGYEFELSKIVLGTMAKSGEVVETCTVTWGGQKRGGDNNVQRQSAKDFARQVLELIGEPATLGDIMDTAGAEGIRKPERGGVQMALDRGCRGDGPMFKLCGSKQITKSKTANLYGLCEW